MDSAPPRGQQVHSTVDNTAKAVYLSRSHLRPPPSGGSNVAVVDAQAESVPIELPGSNTPDTPLVIDPAAAHPQALWAAARRQQLARATYNMTSHAAADAHAVVDKENYTPLHGGGGGGKEEGATPKVHRYDAHVEASRSATSRATSAALEALTPQQQQHGRSISAVSADSTSTVALVGGAAVFQARHAPSPSPASPIPQGSQTASPTPSIRVVPGAWYDKMKRARNIATEHLNVSPPPPVAAAAVSDPHNMTEPFVVPRDTHQSPTKQYETPPPATAAPVVDNDASPIAYVEEDVTQDAHPGEAHQEHYHQQREEVEPQLLDDAAIAKMRAGGSHKPTITTKAKKLNLGGVPVHERVTAKGAMYQSKKDERRREAEAARLAEAARETFSPKINRRPRPTGASSPRTATTGKDAAIVHDPVDGKTALVAARMENATPAGRLVHGTTNSAVAGPLRADDPDKQKGPAHQRLHAAHAEKSAKLAAKQAEEVRKAAEAFSYSPKLTPFKSRSARSRSGSPAHRVQGPHHTAASRSTISERTSDWQVAAKLRRDAARDAKMAAEVAECTHAPTINPGSSAIATLMLPLSSHNQSGMDGGRTPSTETGDTSRTGSPGSHATAVSASTPVEDRLLAYGRKTAEKHREQQIATSDAARLRANHPVVSGLDGSQRRALRRSSEDDDSEGSLLIEGDKLGADDDDHHNNSSTGINVFERLNTPQRNRRETPPPTSSPSAQRRRESDSRTPPPFRPELCAKSRALVGADLPAKSSPIHERLLAEGKSHERRRRERQAQLQQEDAAMRQTNRYVSATSQLLVALKRSGEEVDSSQPRTGTPTRGDAARLRLSDAQSVVSEAESENATHTPRVTETSRVLDRLKVERAYGPVAPGRVDILLDRHRESQAALQRAREEKDADELFELMEARRLAADRRKAHLAASREMLRKEAADSHVQQQPPSSRSSSAVAGPSADAGVSGTASGSSEAKPPSVYERQMAWKATKDQQLGRRRDRQVAVEEATAKQQCTFSPRVNRNSPLKRRTEPSPSTPTKKPAPKTVAGGTLHRKPSQYATMGAARRPQQPQQAVHRDPAGDEQTVTFSPVVEEHSAAVAAPPSQAAQQQAPPAEANRSETFGAAPPGFVEVRRRTPLLSPAALAGSAAIDNANTASMNGSGLASPRAQRMRSLRAQHDQDGADDWESASLPHQ